MRLQTRLFLSYTVMLAVTLGVISGLLLLLLSTQPAPPQNTYRELSALLRAVDLRDLLGENPRDLLQQRGVEARRAEVVTRLAESVDRRIVLVEEIDDATGVVLFDSDGTFEAGQRFVFRTDSFSLPRLVLRQGEAVYGGFQNPDGSVWLYAGIHLPRPRAGAADALLIAEPRPQQPFSAVLLEFRENLFAPLLQSAFVGMLVAFVLAAIISRTIASPLKTVAKAATHVAEGDYDQQVPVRGPLEISAVAEAFNHMTTQVKANRRAQKDFMASVSHDLKTPLTSIQGYSQAILDGTAPDPAHAAGIIYDEATRLNRLVVELTDLIRLEARTLPMKHQQIDLSLIAEGVGQRLAVVAEKAQIRLHVQTQPVPPVLGDGDRLAQVVTNLVSNAIKYTPAGGAVRVLTRQNGSGVEFIVQDNGIGIPKEDLPRVFERFYRVDKSLGPDRGTGLGLAIVQEIVDAHDGRVTVSSPGVNKGSTFTVWLPVAGNRV